MNIISEKQFKEFANKYFPGKATHYDETYAFIQAGSMYGDRLHYECDETSVNLHIECSEWRPIRDYLRQNLKRDRLTPSHWNRQDCQWTIDNEIQTVKDLFQAFLEIRSIIEPVIEKFEGKEPQDYSHYTLVEAKKQTAESKTSAKTQEEINLTLLTDKEMLVLYDTKIANIQFVSAALCGGWMGTSVIPEVYQVKRNKDELTVQMHLYADNYCKGVQLLLKQNGDDICGKIEWAKGTKRRAERNERIEKILQSDWNDTSDADVANLDTNIPIGKKGYGIEKIIVDIEPQEEVSKEEAKEQEAKPEKAMKVADKTNEKESKIALAKTETNQRIKITPVDLPPVTIEREIDQLGITLTKTYDKFAEASIQGVDAAGRRTKDIQTLTKLPELTSLKKVQLTGHIPVSGNKNEVVKKLFNTVQNTGRPSYEKSFWEHLAKECDSSTFVVETGHELKSTFGVVSIIPSLRHSFSVADDNVVSTLPTFCFDNNYFDSQIDPEDITSLFSAENAVEIKEDEIIFGSSFFTSSSPKKFQNLRTIIGSYKTPRSFNNSCTCCGGEAKIRCKICDGSGEVLYQIGEHNDGRPKMKTKQCGNCYGRGFFVCKDCNGTGKIDQGTGMIQILENATIELRLRENIVISNSFFNSNINTGNDIKNIKKLSGESSDRKKRKKELYQKLKETCKKFVENWEELLLRYEDLDFTTYHESDFKDVDDAKGLISDWEKTQYGWIFFPDGYSDVEYYISEIEELSESKTSIENKINSLFSNLFHKKDVEVIFKNQQEIAYDNKHKSIPFKISEGDMNNLYLKNLQKAHDVFKLDNQDERILCILEKHTIEDNLMKITIPLEATQSFVVYYSEKNNLLFCSKNIPEIVSVRKQFEAEERIEQQQFEEQRKRKEQERQERARKKEEQRQAHYSQSMDALLGKEPTKKIGMFSKLFKTDSYKKASDAEKTIKLLIYMAKADGTLDIDEKESLTAAILNTFSDAYTAENRQIFIDMLDSDSLPELIKEDVNFSSIKALNEAIKKMKEMAEIGGITPKEKELLERVRELTGNNK